MSSFYGRQNYSLFFFDFIANDLSDIKIEDVALGRYILIQDYDGGILCGGTIYSKVYENGVYNWKEIAYLPERGPDAIYGGSATNLINFIEEEN